MKHTMMMATIEEMILGENSIPSNCMLAEIRTKIPDLQNDY